MGVLPQQQGSDIARFEADLEREGRPTRVSGEAMNFLMAGIDDGRGADLREMLGAVDWKPGSFRSDTLMVLHLEAERESAQIVSIPRDSYVPVPGLGHRELNAAFSAGGPTLLTQAVEDLTGTYIAHITVVDWDGLDGIVDAIGGVEVHVPTTVTDSNTGQTWQEGRQNLLRGMLAKTASAGVLANPVRVTGLVAEFGSCWSWTTS